MLEIGPLRPSAPERRIHRVAPAGDAGSDSPATTASSGGAGTDREAGGRIGGAGRTAVGAGGAASAAARTHDLLAAAAVIVGLSAGALVLFEALWRRPATADLVQQPGGWPGALVVVACSAIVHEALHVIGWRAAARVPWRSVSVQPTWRVMGLVARLSVAVPARAHRVGLLAPALLLAMPPLVLGLTQGRGLWTLWGIFFLVECFSDLAALVAMRRVPSSALVLELTGSVRRHPEPRQPRDG